MGKYYAVRKGHQTGIFNDWPTCQKAVKGYSGAEFKSFKTKKEAEDGIRDRNVTGVQTCALPIS